MRKGEDVILGRCDPHLHTTGSDGLGSPRAVVEGAVARGLSLVAVTDHDAVAGAMEARAIAVGEGQPLDVIIGTEVTTRRGVHLLALFIDEPVPMFRPVAETIREIARRGGLALAPHPLSRLTPSMGRRMIDRLVADGVPLAAVETVNPSPAGRWGERVKTLNIGWRLAEFGGSDAHFIDHIGAAYTIFPGTTASEFRRAIEERTTVGARGEDPLPRIPLSDYARQSGRSMLLNPAQKIARRAVRR